MPMGTNIKEFYFKCNTQIFLRISQKPESIFKHKQNVPPSKQSLACTELYFDLYDYEKKIQLHWQKKVGRLKRPNKCDQVSCLRSRILQKNMIIGKEHW